MRKHIFIGEDRAVYALSPLVSFIKYTQAAPIISITPAVTSMFISGGSIPSGVNSARILPPNAAATICGIQMVPLNSPRYVPMCPPDKALVRMVKGSASMAAHAQPISRKDTNSTYGLCTK